MDAHKIYNQKYKFTDEHILQMTMKLILDCLDWGSPPFLVITTTTLMYCQKHPSYFLKVKMFVGHLRPAGVASIEM